MFVRVKRVTSGGRSYQYLHVVENRRENGRVRQHIVGSLGRLDHLLESGDLERVITQLVEHCPAVKILRAEATGGLEVMSDRVWGPVLVFGRLWEDLGLKDLLRAVVGRRRLEFDFERMVFGHVLQRLLSPGSDLKGSKWIQTIEEEGLRDLRLPHFYRSLSILWRAKSHIETTLHRRTLNLFNQELDLVFFDTTSVYFEGTGLREWAMLGKSKDHRPDHLQLVIGVVMRRDGFPIACEIWPGNTNDAKTLVPVVEDLRNRFEIRKVVVVCDRGMVSAKNLEEISKAGYEYIVGVKMRGLKEVRDEVLPRAQVFKFVSENLQVKEIDIEGRRYVICFNPDEAEKDRNDREAILEKIRTKLASGGVKKLINNRGYTRFLKISAESATIDEKKAEEEAIYDGKYVLRTTTALPAAEVALAYKHLTWIERLWRELKDVVEIRPIFHHLKRDNVRGHIFASFLSLYLAAALKRRLAEAGLKFPWNDVIRDLSELRAVRVFLDGSHFLLRSPVKGTAGRVFAAVGVKVPSLVQPV